MHNDVEYAYRQDSDFFYLTGFNEAEAVEGRATPRRTQICLVCAAKRLGKKTWHGYRAGVEGAKELYGADEAFPIAELAEKLPKYLEKADRIYYHFGRDRTF